MDVEADKMVNEEIDEQEIKDVMREVFKNLARALEYAVDNNMEIRNMSDEELEAVMKEEDG